MEERRNGYCSEGERMLRNNMRHGVERIMGVLSM